MTNSNVQASDVARYESWKWKVEALQAKDLYSGSYDYVSPLLHTHS